MMESVPGFKIQIIKCAFFSSDTNLGEVPMTEFALESLEFSFTTKNVALYYKQCHEVKWI